MPVIAITRLRVRSWRYLPIFFLQAQRSARQAARAEGNLAIRLLRDRRNTFWTATVWTSEAAMKGFMLSGVHRRVMGKLPDWCDEAAVVHWLQDSSEPPTWAEAYSRLQRGGRRSKVKNPSPAHTAHELPEPRVGPTAEVRFK